MINFILVLFLLFPKSAYAYLDPGTGSYIIQIIMATFLGGGLLLRTYWDKIKSVIAKKKENDEESK